MRRSCAGAISLAGASSAPYVHGIVIVAALAARFLGATAPTGSLHNGIPPAYARHRRVPVSTHFVVPGARDGGG